MTVESHASKGQIRPTVCWGLIHQMGSNGVTNQFSVFFKTIADQLFLSVKNR